MAILWTELCLIEENDLYTPIFLSLNWKVNNNGNSNNNNSNNNSSNGNNNNNNEDNEVGVERVLYEEFLLAWQLFMAILVSHELGHLWQNITNFRILVKCNNKFKRHACGHHYIQSYLQLFRTCNWKNAFIWNLLTNLRSFFVFLLYLTIFKAFFMQGLGRSRKIGLFAQKAHLKLYLWIYSVRRSIGSLMT